MRYFSRASVVAFVALALLVGAGTASASSLSDAPNAPTVLKELRPGKSVTYAHGRNGWNCPRGYFTNVNVYHVDGSHLGDRHWVYRRTMYAWRGVTFDGIRFLNKTHSRVLVAGWCPGSHPWTKLVQADGEPSPYQRLLYGVKVPLVEGTVVVEPADNPCDTGRAWGCAKHRLILIDEARLNTMTLKRVVLIHELGHVFGEYTLEDKGKAAWMEDLGLWYEQTPWESWFIARDGGYFSSNEKWAFCYQEAATGIHLSEYSWTPSLYEIQEATDLAHKFGGW